MPTETQNAASPPPSTAAARYAEVNERLSALNAAGAGMITLLTALSVWGRWTTLAEILAVQIPVIAFNTWVNLVYLPRRGRSAELLRTLVNISLAIVVNRIAGWPMPVWLWLPYVALAFDHLDRRVAKWSLIGFCVVQDGFALLDGVPWIYPLSATVFALFASQVSRQRFSAMREMLVRSDSQRRQIEAAHAKLHEAHEQLKSETTAREAAERELRQAHKLEAVGRLAAGVAHEINTPVQFVGHSLQFLSEACADLCELIEKHQAVEREVLAGRPAQAAADTARRARETVDLPYILENLPPAFQRATEGLARVTTIVHSMKEFAHPDQREMAPLDLNRAVESTLIIARNEYKYVADVETSYGSLPPVLCHGGEVNQALLNIIVNGAHAIGEVVAGSDRRGRLTLRTSIDGDSAVISISDTGPGIPPDARERIFDPFFTTKRVGKGTGQGLAIARSIIVDKHHGTLDFETELGKGTTFHIRLPIAGAGATAAAA
ncbi:MAG TPA: ATP-binding protein [Polyangiaceae bacterium]